MGVTAEVMGEATAAGEGRIPPLATAAAAAAAAKAGWLLGMDVRIGVLEHTVMQARLRDRSNMQRDYHNAVSEQRQFLHNF